MSLADRFDHAQAVPVTLGSLSTADGVQDRCRRYVASQALDVDDCRELLEMLGLIRVRTDDDTVIQAVSETEGRA